MLSTPFDLRTAQFDDFYGKWNLFVNFRRQSGQLIQLLCIPAYRVSRDRRLGGEIADPPVWVRPVIYGVDAKPFDAKPWMWPQEDIAELWLVPGDPFGPDRPKYPLPRHVDVAVQGVRYRPGGRTHFWTAGRFESVRLDRAKAIKLGIVDMLEPADDFYNFASPDRKVVKLCSTCWFKMGVGVIHVPGCPEA